MDAEQLRKIKFIIRELTNEERVAIFSEYCELCGSYDKDKPLKCQCWNDK